jgi:hypothetical protein
VEKILILAIETKCLSKIHWLMKRLQHDISQIRAIHWGISSGSMAGKGLIIHVDENVQLLVTISVQSGAFVVNSMQSSCLLPAALLRKLSDSLNDDNRTDPLVILTELKKEVISSLN